jgi:hypothetical protein
VFGLVEAIGFGVVAEASSEGLAVVHCMQLLPAVDRHAEDCRATLGHELRVHARAHCSVVHSSSFPFKGDRQSSMRGVPGRVQKEQWAGCPRAGTQNDRRSTD